jgi:hypothetical protein
MAHGFAPVGQLPCSNLRQAAILIPDDRVCAAGCMLLDVSRPATEAAPADEAGCG